MKEKIKSDIEVLNYYIKEVLDFDNMKDWKGVFESEKGKRSDLMAMIGRVVINFQSLEDALSEYISMMLALEEDPGHIITAELSFKAKVNLFASLYHLQKDIKEFNFRKSIQSQYFKKLLKALKRCEELRNQIVHSSIEYSWSTDRITRHKKTAKSKSGLIKLKENIDLDYLFVIGDYITCIEEEVRNFFLTYSTSPTGTTVNLS